MSQSSLAESTLEKEVLASHEVIQIKSPGHEEQEVKDQDRVGFTEDTDQNEFVCQYAVACDGTTTSPYAAEAASYVASLGAELFQADGLRRATEYLREQRAALLEKPLNLGEEHSPALRTMFEEIVKQKYRSSYQTTLVAARLQRGAPGEVLIRVIGCGDSAFFIFRDNDDRLHNNVGVVSALDEFKHGSPFTAVLPDSYNDDTDYVLFDNVCSEDVNVLLCSDGFYDGFANFKEMHDWLKEHREDLRALRGEHECLADLHTRLVQRKGDDDISFIWLYPRARLPARFPPEDAEDQEDNIQQPMKDGRRRSFIRWFLALLGFLRLGQGKRRS